MADDPKTTSTSPGSDQPPAANTPSTGGTGSNTAAGAAGKEPGSGAPPQNQGAADQPATGTTKSLLPDALADGTVPTVLKAGLTKLDMPKGKASLTNVYRRADIMTTLLTLAGAIIAAVIILGGYYFVTKNTAKPTPTPKVTTLSQADLSKLQSFFEGNTAGGDAQVLTISSSSLFKNRVAISSDLKVLGGLDVSGSTTLADLTVNKTSTLGVTNVRGALGVDGPLTVQSPALFNAGGSFKGNLATSGNGSFGGSLSAGSITTTNLTVSGALNVDGHLNLGGQTPSATGIAGVSSNANVQGNDAAGAVSVTVSPTSGSASGADLVKITFHNAYPVVPVIIITPIGRSSAIIQPFISATGNSFIISAANLPASPSSTTYSFNYWVIQ